MNGINLTIYQQLCEFPLFDENNLLFKIEKFLNLQADDYFQRQNLALEISSLILAPHQKQDLPDLAVKLAKLERNLHEISPNQRDHICHSLLTFLLGCYIISKLKLHHKHTDFLFQWKLTALLHDVGYPTEILDRISNSFYADYERELLNIEGKFEPTQARRLLNYLDLYTTEKNKDRNTIDIINKRLEKWEISINSKKILDAMIAGKKFDDNSLRTDHGIVSSILIMKAIDKKYEENNPNQISGVENPWSFSNLEKQITNACSAIFVHNLKLKKLLWDFNKCPLASLLKICDELQSWGRPSDKKVKGENPDHYEICFNNGKFLFYVKNDSLPFFEEKIKQVKNFPLILKNKDSNC